MAGQQIDYKDQGVSLRRTDFNPMYPTKIVIHGFTQDEKEKWLHEMKDALLTTVSLAKFFSQGYYSMFMKEPQPQKAAHRRPQTLSAENPKNEQKMRKKCKK